MTPLMLTICVVYYCSPFMRMFQKEGSVFADCTSSSVYRCAHVLAFHADLRVIFGNFYFATLYGHRVFLDV